MALGALADKILALKIELNSIETQLQNEIKDKCIDCRNLNWCWSSGYSQLNPRNGDAGSWVCNGFRGNIV